MKIRREYAVPCVLLWQFSLSHSFHMFSLNHFLLSSLLFYSLSLCLINSPSASTSFFPNIQVHHKYTVRKCQSCIVRWRASSVNLWEKTFLSQFSGEDLKAAWLITKLFATRREKEWKLHRQRWVGRSFPASHRHCGMLRRWNGRPPNSTGASSIKPSWNRNKKQEEEERERKALWLSEQKSNGLTKVTTNLFREHCFEG